MRMSMSMDMQSVRTKGGVILPPQLPTDVSGMRAWWDPADAATITQSGGDVSQWLDKINGYTATQATGANKPQTGLTAINGNNVLTFLGGNRRLSVSSGLFDIASGANTLFICCRGNAGFTDTRTLLRGENGGDAWGMAYMNMANGSGSMNSGGGFAGAPAGTPTNVLIYCFTRSGAVITPYTNGTAGTTNTAANVALLNSITIGGYAAANNAQAWQGEIMDIGAWNKACSKAELNYLGNLFKNKWAGTWNVIP